MNGTKKNFIAYTVKTPSFSDDELDLKEIPETYLKAYAGENFSIIFNSKGKIDLNIFDAGNQKSILKALEVFKDYLKTLFNDWETYFDLKQENTFNKKMILDFLPYRENIELPYLFTFYSIKTISNNYEMDRILSFSGEELGREFASGLKIKSKKELFEELKKFFKENSLGSLEFTKDFSKIELFGGNYTGFPIIGMPYSFFEKGIIKGAMQEFLKQLNFDVRIEKCWGIGDTYCEYKVEFYSL
ncbi:MAG TPA: hypothetical protein VJK05_04680 [archaeon]|nr:hypothetical protein [archaeon]